MEWVHGLGMDGVNGTARVWMEGMMVGTRGLSKRGVDMGPALRVEQAEAAGRCLWLADVACGGDMSVAAGHTLFTVAEGPDGRIWIQVYLGPNKDPFAKFAMPIDSAEWMRDQLIWVCARIRAREVVAAERRAAIAGEG